jgi:aspartate aminotransferase-like enzyme
LKIAVKESAEVIGKSVDARETAMNATIEALKNRELSDFVAQRPELKEQLARIGEAAKADLKDIKAAAAAQKEAMAQLEEALKKMDL